MSAITWTADVPMGSPVAAAAVKIWARRFGFGLGLVMATATAYVGILLTVLMATGIVQV